MKPTQPTAAAAAALLVLGVLGAGLGKTQTFLSSDTLPSEPDAEVPPAYVVEFLIFAYNDLNSLEEEFVPEQPHWPESLLDIRLTSNPEMLPGGSAAWYLDDVLRPEESPEEAELSAAEIGADTENSANTPADGPAATIDEYGNTIGSAPAPDDDGPWYRMLAPEELELGAALTRLGRLDAYTPLLHAGWSQATLFEDEAQAFELAWLGKLRPAGSIRLHRSRFLHLTVDVSLQHDYRYRQAPLAPDAEWPLAEFLRPLSYRIDLQRRVRSGELHFFDHPAFGILIMIRPAPETPDAASGVAIGPAA